MSRPRSRLSHLAAHALVIAGLGGSLAALLALNEACNPRSSAVGPGGECFLATDCAPGLVCLEQPNKTRVCDNDLSRVAGRGPPEGGRDDDGGEDEGGIEEEGGVPVEEDSGQPPQDTGAPPQDTGAPPQDSGSGNGDD